MRILVCGGRDFYDYRLLHNTLEHYCNREKESGRRLIIINGDAHGADKLSSAFADIHLCTLIKYPASWEKHGKAAGPIRNKQMLEEGEPDIVIAFPGGKGTANMIKLAKDAGVEVIEVNE